MSTCFYCGMPHLYDGDHFDGWRYDSRCAAMVCPDCQLRATLTGGAS